jgi:hypothetical protein
LLPKTSGKRELPSRGRAAEGPDPNRPRADDECDDCPTTIVVGGFEKGALSP